MTDNTAAIIVHEHTRQFHLTNGRISYVFHADGQGKLINLYFGAAVPDREDFSYLTEVTHSPTTTCRIPGNLTYTLERMRQEFPEYGGGNYRRPALEVRQGNGSTLTDLTYAGGYRIIAGKPRLAGLPATYVEHDDEATTLEIELIDRPTGLTVILQYTIFRDQPVIARSVRITNGGGEPVSLERVMSLNLDLPDRNYTMTEFAGAWARERHPHTQPLHYGVQQIESLRNASGHFLNPCAVFARPATTESQGEAIGVAFEYSGNFDLHAEVDTFDVTRVQVGINDFGHGALRRARRSSRRRRCSRFRPRARPA